MLSDQALVEALLHDGDESAFRELYRRHTPRLYQLVLRLVGNEQEAEDVLQETWLKACDKLDGFRWEAKLSTWLTAIGLNLCREHLRRRGRMASDGLARGEEPALPAPAAGAWIDLERAIAGLPDGYRAVLVLHDLEGYTHEEIGERLGIAPGTSKSQLHWARRAVRALLAPGAGEPHVAR